LLYSKVVHYYLDMPVVDSLLSGVVKRKRSNFEKKLVQNQGVQNETLKKLIQKARFTQFGQHYEFEDILDSEDIVKEFQSRVPVFTYDKMFASWWYKFFDGKSDFIDVSWPGRVKFFGLTSGTANAASKRVPLTSAMLRSIRKVGIRQLLALSEFKLPKGFYQKGVLMLGGSTELVRMDTYFEGDLSGIMAGRLPFWFNRWYKPGKPISRERDWNAKLERIVEQAPKWDIGGISGVPAWNQILLEMIIERYKLKNIHEIWPNLTVFAHGGVNMDPYRASFDKLMGKQIYYLETYLASEGFLAFQKDPDTDMQLVLDNGLFFEFVPFNQNNFNPDGQMVENPETLLLNQIQEGVDYAILLSTNAGVWRYLIGDTIRFTNKERAEIIITGRTKHFLSLCGEHLSVDNMTKAVSLTANHFGFNTREFTAYGIRYENLFAHKWFISSDKDDLDKEEVKKKLDEYLCELNDDYCTERKAALKEIFVELIPVQVFYEFMKAKGKEGGQHKFPRVLKDMEDDWEQFLKTKGF
jgi:hypothetical protein